MLHGNYLRLRPVALSDIFGSVTVTRVSLALGIRKTAKMADEMKEDTSVLEGLLSTSGQLESLESLDAAFTTNSGSFRQRHVSDSVSLSSVFYLISKLFRKLN